MLKVESVLTGFAGSPYYTRLFFDRVGAADATTVASNVRAFWLAMAGGGTPILTGGGTITVLPEVTDYSVSTGQPQAVYVVDPGAPVALGSGTTVPRATQGLIRLNTDIYRAGRRVRGKIFVPCIAASNNTTAGRPGTSAQTAMESAASTLLSSGLAVYTRPREGVSGAIAEVTGVDAWSEWAVLRSRRD